MSRGDRIERSAWRVPGRIEVLGKHTDYGGGRVLVCAVDRGITVHAERTTGEPGTLEAVTAAFPGVLRLRAGSPVSLPAGHWGRYLAAVLDRLTRNFGPLGPARLSITSDLPPASGLSSSSAMICAAALALADLEGLPEDPRWASQIHDRMDLAGYLASFENGRDFGLLRGRPGVGTHGGSLDHTGMLAGADGLVSYAEFDPARILDRVALPAGTCLVVGVSGVLAEKTGTAQAAYNRGPTALAAILARWNDRAGRADATLQAALRSLVGDDLAAPLTAGDVRVDALRACTEPGVERDRLDQFLTESGVLVPRAHAALRDQDTAAFGEQVRASQQLAETALANQVPQTIDLVRIAERLGALAASSFGAGFGGSVWALVPVSDADAFAADWMRCYRSLPAAPAGAQAFVTRPGPAGHRIPAAS